jgi:hypothetical protein
MNILVISLIVVISGFLLAGLTLYQFIVKRKLLSASLNGALGLILLCIAVFIYLLLFNIQSYIQLTQEQHLAEIEVSHLKNGTQAIRIIINGEHKTYAISADEWRLDARFVKWKPWVALLGKAPVVRLESISGRNKYAGDRLIQSYNLHEDFEIIDKIITSLSNYLGMIDTMYGSSVYMPLKDGARYHVSANHSGLIVRPVNREGERALMQWDNI